MESKGPSRKARLASLLHREIATCLQRDLKDPRLGFLTVTRVELSDDLKKVTAFYTLLAPDSKRRLVAAALESARGYVQRAYAPVVKTRLLPILSFAYDDLEQRRQGMDALIKAARASDPDGGATPEPPSGEPLPEGSPPPPPASRPGPQPTAARPPAP
jgi:ribosome-binding factor A